FGDATASTGPGPDDRHDFDIKPRRIYRLKKAPDLARMPQMLRDRGTFIDTERLIVLQRCRLGIKVIGLLTDINHGNAHTTPPADQRIHRRPRRTLSYQLRISR